MTIQQRLDTFARCARPDEDMLEEARRQADYMIKNLKKRVSDDGTFVLEKVLKAGSNAKHTSVRPNENNEFDVDLAAFFDGEGAEKEELDKLLDFLREQLIDIYPQKDKDDFEKERSAVHVKFRSGIELDVDVTPIILDEALDAPNAGYIPRRSGEWRLTSTTQHTAFIQSRTERSKALSAAVRFNRLLRVMKWWNNRQGDARLVTFLIDLLTAKAFDEQGVREDWQVAIRDVFGFILRHGLAEPIVFSDFYDPSAVDLPDDAVVILDPVNAENNPAHYLTEAHKQVFLERVAEAYDTICYAASLDLDSEEEQAVDLWAEVFGDEFYNLSQED